MYYLFYKVNKNDIAAIKFLLESYENIFSVSTIDPKIPKIQITVAPDFLHDAKEILADLKCKFFMDQLDEDPSQSQGKY